MSITISCSNGHELKVADKYAGRKVQCPKCKASVLVPEPEPEILDAAYPDFLSPSSEEFASNQPQDFNWLRTNEAESIPSSGHVRVLKDSVQSSIPEAGKRTKLRSLILVIAFCCMLFLAVLFGTLTWVLFGRTGELEAAIEPGAAKPFKDQSKNSNNESSQSADPKLEVAPSVPQAALPPPLSLSGISTSDPTRLTAKNIDNRVECFGWRDVTFASAYDEPTGRIAIANNTIGILIFDIVDCMKGNLGPIITIPTNGLPNSICIKRLKEKRFFVYSESNSTILHLVDADTLQQVGEHTVLEAAAVGFLNSSSNPEDPYVYFTYSSNPRSIKRGVYDLDVLSRINLETGETEATTEKTFVDFDLSPDGKRIYARTPSNGAFYSDWENLTKVDVFLDRGKADKSVFSVLSEDRRVQPIYQLKSKIALDRKVFSLANNSIGKQFYATFEADFSPHLQFESKPVVFGLGKNELVFASPNDFRPLCKIALPESWDRLSSIRDLRSEKTHEELRQDWRYRQDICVNTRSVYYKPIADNTRNLAIAVFDQHMIVVPLERLDLPNEPILVPSTTLPETIKIGTAIELRLSHDKDVSIQLLANRQGMTNKLLPVVGTPPPQESLGMDAAIIYLNASVFPDQSTLILQDSLVTEMFFRKKRVLPFAIQIGPERMLVQKVDSSRGLLLVDRTISMEHSVTSPITVFDEAIQENLPTVDDGLFGWTPTAKWLGRQNIRMKATRGGTTAEWLFPVEIVSTGSSLSPDFYVTGIQPDYNSTTAVIWGKSLKGADLSSDWRPTNDAPTILALIDTESSNITCRASVPFIIDSATLHGSSIFATCETLAPDPIELRYQLVEFNAKTLQATNRFPIQNLGRVEIIADKYLVVTDRTRSLTLEVNQSLYRFPEMTLVAKTLAPGFPKTGRLKDRWVLDGVVWDKNLKSRQLLLFPSKFHWKGNAVATKNSIVEFQVEGPQAGLWNAKSNLRPRDYQMRDLNVILSARGNGLHVFPHSPSGYINAGIGTTVIPYGNEVSEDDPRLQQKRIGEVTENSNQILIASGGKIRIVDKSPIKETNVPFRFEERQEKFVLDASKINRVEYSAKDATNYKLSLWYKTPFSQWDAIAPSLVLESKDGKFDLQFDPDVIALNALRLMKKDFRQIEIDLVSGTALDRQKMVSDYVKSTSQYYKDVTGKDLRTVPLAVTALVEAEREADSEKAAILHMFLVEPPIASIQKVIASPVFK